jgi:small subunit ribosomal protein S21
MIFAYKNLEGTVLVEKKVPELLKENPNEDDLGEGSTQKTLGENSAQKAVEIFPYAKNSKPRDPDLRETKDNRNFEILKQFRRECAGIVSEIREREAYMKPSVKRKKKDEKALKRLRKRERMNQRYER